MPRPVLLVVTLAALWSGIAVAHALKVFAWAEGEHIHGSVYFAGGGGAPEARIEVHGPDGALVAELEPDTAGEFTVTTDAPGAHRVIAITPAGHRAEWGVMVAGPGNAASGTASVSDLAAQVERAVARQVAPLRAELKAHAERARLGDILGGIGIIFGVAGIALWWRSRERR